MNRIEPRIIRTIRLAQDHCGHDELVDKYERQLTRTMRFIASEIEALATKVGMP